MKIYYHDLFTFPLPNEHRFPIGKYRELRDQLVSSGLISSENLLIPEAATDEEILLAHDKEYADKVIQGTLSDKEIRRMGFPWSQELLERARRSVGSTIAACKSALTDGLAINLAGGTHHACADHGEGFCVFNDLVIAARVIQNKGSVSKVAIVDCDVHQGNGTASIVRDDSSIFTFSIHGEKNFPFKKPSSDLDIGLKDGSDDQTYLVALDSGLSQVFDRFNPDLVIYVSGADPYIGDRLGRLSLTKEGLAERDRIVIKTSQNKQVPIAVVMGGGYAPDIQDIVDIHLQTIKISLEIANRVKLT